MILTWRAYCERLEIYIVANKIKDTIKIAMLISVMGKESYELLLTLSSPKNLRNKYPEAMTVIEKSFTTKTIAFGQRRPADK